MLLLFFSFRNYVLIALIESYFTPKSFRGYSLDQRPWCLHVLVIFWTSFIPSAIELLARFQLPTPSSSKHSHPSMLMTTSLTLLLSLSLRLSVSVKGISLLYLAVTCWSYQKFHPRLSSLLIPYSFLGIWILNSVVSSTSLLSRVVRMIVRMGFD